MADAWLWCSTAELADNPSSKPLGGKGSRGRFGGTEGKVVAEMA
jgi:hypothetical protein